MIKYTEEYLNAAITKICNDFMVTGLIDNIKQSKCSCMDQPGYLLFSRTDNNQMIYISNDLIFRGGMENADSEVFAYPYRSRQGIIDFVQWFYIGRKLGGLRACLEEHVSFFEDDDCTPEDLSEEEVKELLFNTFIGGNSMNGLYCQKQGTGDCIFFSVGCDVQKR